MWSFFWSRLRVLLYRGSMYSTSFYKYGFAVLSRSGRQIRDFEGNCLGRCLVSRSFCRWKPRAMAQGGQQSYQGTVHLRPERRNCPETERLGTCKFCMLLEVILVIVWPHLVFRSGFTDSTSRTDAVLVLHRSIRRGLDAGHRTVARKAQVVVDSPRGLDFKGTLRWSLTTILGWK